MMDWRSWAYNRISTCQEILDAVGVDGVIGGGALEGAVAKKPFVVISFDQTNPGPFPGSETQGMSVWVHDEPGDYLRIGTLLKAARDVLVGQVASLGAVACVWQGDSQDLSDESLGTITRNASFMMTNTEEY